MDNLDWFLLVAGVLAGVGVILILIANTRAGGGGGGVSCRPYESVSPKNSSTLTNDDLILLSGDGVMDFYSLASGGNRDLNGNASSESGISSKADLSKYPLTYPVGHSGNGLSNGSWQCYVESNSSKINVDKSPGKVLVVQGGKYFLESDQEFEGIVVRHGAHLFINDKPATIKVNFILIESGGLFQAGSRYKDKYRFMNMLNIVLTHPSGGYADNHDVASQYAYNIYAPGVKRVDSGVGVTSYLGTQESFMNSFGTKVIAVGFNGNYQLAGYVGTKRQPYEGTWNAFTSEGKGHITKNEIMTYFKQGDSSAEKANIETEYATMWCRLKEGVYSAGDTVIHIDSRDSPYLHWEAGDEIVITCSTDQYNTLGVKDSSMIPIWMNCSESSSASANQAANTEFQNTFKGKDTGVEVATIKSISGDTITLESPLKFNHRCFRETIKRDLSGNGTKEIVIDTNLHVALLTRNILITSQFSNGGSGCNDTQDKVQCNYDNLKDNCQAKLEVYQCCYKDRTASQYCGSETPKPNSGGHWMFNTSNLTGCNAIYGGSQMFRYGSSVNLDGVEMKAMGCTANFGKVGRYPIHFHLSGYAKSWKGYLPEEASIEDRVNTRESVVSNCSIWASMNRWVTTHGAHEVDIKNNIGFIAYGSGYFVEDGTEIDNTFEHNMAICCLSASYHAYWNPLPLYASVSSDLAPASAFWLKNNQNRCFRNVACCSPSPIIALWAVPQAIAYLRGPSTVCLGDPTLELPGLGSSWNAWTENSHKCAMNQDMQSAKDLGLGDDGNCWVPSEFYTKRPLAESVSHCPAFSNINCENPFNLMSENIVYCMFGAMSEFPEALGTPLGNYSGYGEFGTTNAWNIGVGEPIDTKTDVAQWLSYDSNNSCTDTNTQCTYFGTKWGGTGIGDSQYPFQPLSKSELDTINAGDQKFKGIAGEPQADAMPKIFSNWLCWNMAPNAGILWGGAGWSKNSPSWLINCCFLQTGGGNTSLEPGTGSQGTWDPVWSSVWASMTGDDVNVYTNAYYVMHNMISNGGVGMPPNPTVISGDKTFIGKSDSCEKPAQAIPNEYADAAKADNKYFFTIEPGDYFEDAFWTTPAPVTGGTLTEYKLVKPSEWKSNAATEKYPYVCKNSKLWKLSDITTTFTDEYNPDWLGIIANSQLGHFMNDYAKNLGDEICSNVSKIPGCEAPPQGAGFPLYC